MKRTIFVSIIALGLLLGCATVDRSYEEENIFEAFSRKGEVTVLLNRAIPGLTVVMDNKILLDSRGSSTRRVNIKNIPYGEHTIGVFADSWQLKENFNYSGKIEVDSEYEEPVMLQVPPYSALYWIYVIGVAVVSALPSVVVYYH
jgi:hypothetical protein